jgi:pyrroline-5-carboxylate reductase
MGTINCAVVRGLLTSPNPPSSIVVSPRNAKNAAALKSEFPGIIEIAADNQGVVDKCEWVIVAIPPKRDVRALTMRCVTNLELCANAPDLLCRIVRVEIPLRPNCH